MNSEDMKLRLLMQRSLRVFGIGIIALLIVLVVETGAAAYPTATDVNIQGSVWHWVPEKIVPVSGIGYSDYYPEYHLDADMGTFMMDTPFNSVSYIERYFDLSSDGSSLSLTVWGARNINGWCGDSVTVTVSVIDSGNITHQLGSFVPVQLDGGVGQGETKKFNISNFASQKVKIRIKQTSSGEHCTYGYYRDIAVIPASAQWGTPTQLTYNTASDYFPSIAGDGSKIAFESYVDGDIDIFVINSDGTDLTQLTHNTALDRFPSTSGDGSKIAFASDVDGDWEIFVINSDGTGLTPLTSNIAWASCPSISGDGNKIAFVSGVPGDYEIFVINSDGTGLTQLTHNTALNLYPSISGDGSKIAFYSNVDGDYEIFVINSDGTGLTQLTHNTALDRGPSISDDGSKIAFYSYVDGDPEIVVINSDGTGLTQLTHNTAADFDPSISGDGNKIAFVSGVPDDAEIFVINSDGTGLTQLTSNTAEDGYPSINADGSKIAFCSDVDGDSEIFVVSRTPSILPKGKIAFASSRDGNQEVYVINADGSGHPTNLTNFPDADDGDPTWSPDGVQIAFSSNRSGHWKTYVMDADDGSNQVCLLEGVYDAWGPAWSPDGEEIAFAGQLSSDDDFEIYTMDIQSKALTQVTDNSDTDSHPAWSPNSHKIVFTSTRDDGNHELYVADLLAGTQTRLTDDPAYDDYPEWSPDGSMIVFVSGRDGNLEIYSMDIVSKAITRLTNNECTDKHAQWSPDGQNIVFISDRDGGDMDIYVMKADSTGIMCLVDWEGEETHPTWSSGHSSPPVYSVGQDAPTEAIKNHFIDAYNINGGITVLGNPTTTVHTAWGYLVQDFPGASCYTGGIIMYNPYKDYAYYIHGAIWDRYYSLGGPMAETDIEFELGLPISDIVPHVHTHPPAVSSHGTQFRYQNFEEGALDLNVDTGTVFEIHGTIFAKWRALGYAAGDLGLVTSDEQEAVISAIGTEGRVSDFEGGHIHWHRNGPYANTAFETHGAIDVVYCSEAGSGGWLGFPVSDEYVNPSGYAQSDFEGGYITTTDGVNYEAFVYTTNPPTNLAQFKSDSTTEIPVGGTTDERTVIFKGTVSDPDGDMVKLQVELRRLDEYGGQFDETKGGLKDSDFVASGSEAVAYGIELIDADYHWRARVVDEHGDSSEWQEFGGNDISEADFMVLHTLPSGTINVILLGYVDDATQPWTYRTNYNAPVFRRGVDNPLFMLTLDGPLPSNYEYLFEIYSPNGASPIGSIGSSSFCCWDWTDINGNPLNKDQIPIGIYTVKGYLVNKNNPEDRKIIGFDEFYVIFDFDRSKQSFVCWKRDYTYDTHSEFSEFHLDNPEIWKRAVEWASGAKTREEAVNKTSELARRIDGNMVYHHSCDDETSVFGSDGYDNDFNGEIDEGWWIFKEEDWTRNYECCIDSANYGKAYYCTFGGTILWPILKIPCPETFTKWVGDNGVVNDAKNAAKIASYYDNMWMVKKDFNPEARIPRQHSLGVCQDYAMLTVGYLRAIGVPSRPVIGGIPSKKLCHAWLQWYENGKWNHLDTNHITNNSLWENNKYNALYYHSEESVIFDHVWVRNESMLPEDIADEYNGHAAAYSLTTSETSDNKTVCDYEIINTPIFEPGENSTVKLNITNSANESKTVIVVVVLIPYLGPYRTPSLAYAESDKEITIAANSTVTEDFNLEVVGFTSPGDYNLTAYEVVNNNATLALTTATEVLAKYAITTEMPDDLIYKQPFTFNVTIKNIATAPIHNISVELDTHYYFNTTEPLEKEILELDAGENYTFTWPLTPIDYGNLRVDVIVYTSDAGSVTRIVDISVLQTPKLWITAQVPEKVNKSDDFILNATIFNSGDIPSDSVTLNLTTPENVTANEQSAELGIIEAHENKTCSFRISQNESSDFMIILNATALNVTATGYAFITISQLPISYFTYEPQNLVVTQRITFNASNSTDPDGFITEYEWHFGDGNVTNTTEPIITHSYASTGDYTVNLTVTDDDGATNSTSKIITVTNLCGDVAPCPDCDGTVDMGDVILLLNNVSYPENPRYTLCNDWSGDCRCTGVRDMGDVILLLNNVSYPENPIYALDCC